MKKPIAFAAALLAASLFVRASAASPVREVHEADAVSGHIPTPTASPATLPIQTLCCIPNVGCAPNSANSTCSKWAAGGWPNPQSVYMLLNASAASVTFTPEASYGLGLNIQMRDLSGALQWQYLVGLKVYNSDNLAPEYCFQPTPNSSVSAIDFANFTGETITFQNVGQGVMCVQKSTSSGPLPPPPVPALPGAYLGGLGALLVAAGALAKRKAIFALFG
jgi:hypothetical protein